MHVLHVLAHEIMGTVGRLGSMLYARKSSCFCLLCVCVCVCTLNIQLHVHMIVQHTQCHVTTKLEGQELGTAMAMQLGDNPICMLLAMYTYLIGFGKCLISTHMQ